MSGDTLVALVISFAAGLGLGVDAFSQRGAASCQAPKGGAAIDPAPALHQRARESWILTHPLECPGTWVKNCPDFKPCKPVCLPSGVDDPRALGLEPKGNLKHVR